MGRRRHARGGRLVNALDHLDKPMVAPPSEGTMLPEFPTDLMDEKYAVEPAEPAEPRAAGSFLSASGVDPWPEIRRTLTPRQYELFEYVYRYQMSLNEVAGVTGLQYRAVHRIVTTAKRKLRRASSPKKGK